MNKTTKIVLIGLGVVAVGATAYFLLKPKTEEADMGATDVPPTSNDAPVAKGKKRGIGKKVLGVAIPALGAGMLIQKGLSKRKAKSGNNRMLDVV